MTLYSIEDIRNNVYRMFGSGYDDESSVPVRFPPGRTARRMAECRGLTGAEMDGTAKKIARSIYDFFYFEKQPDGSRRLFLNYARRNRVLRPEGRYFSMETCMEFAIAAGMDYDSYARFSEYLMGFRWHYLRNPEYMAGDFCLRFGLGPERYHELTQYAKEASERQPEDGYLTGVTEEFGADYDEMIDGLPPAGGSFSEEDYVGGLKRFINEHTAYLKGNFSRVMEYIRQMVKFPAEGSFLEKNCLRDETPVLSSLNECLLSATMPWEYKMNVSLEDGVAALFGADSDPDMATIHVHTGYYGINQPDEASRSLRPYAGSECASGRRQDFGRPFLTENYRFDMANMLVIRNDLVRIKMMNMTEKTAKLNLIDDALTLHSFSPLSDWDPFDYIVKCALEIYCAPDEEKPGEFRGMEPYETLCGIKEALSPDVFFR